jgi:hypothetical protein
MLIYDEVCHIRYTYDEEMAVSFLDTRLQLWKEQSTSWRHLQNSITYESFVLLTSLSKRTVPFVVKALVVPCHRL